MWCAGGWIELVKMNPARFHELTARYSQLRIAVVGDVCLSRRKNQTAV